ncbi:nucleotidyltransferase family protein [Rubrivirga sp. S365]|uniref:nucleotidyltransferase family protein n=1 Tax=Rubrivirga sp. S365 TaxID=3076080 RepID=UPI0028CAB049|nr:nucleotidyltransferase family protein [Rubrivirga sp. S365]MDT7856070.1 nucleotidyltransferase family protein [Rubrivirga sp. S365]
MDAMILAAGLGTRLRPLTNHTPKALVEVDGVPMLERVARRLLAAGADRLLVNVSYLADQVEAYVDAADWRTAEGRAVEVVVSDEPDGPLETGGGIKKAAAFFRRDAPFLVHNADILTDVDLRALWEAQRDADDGRLATLATAPARTDRALLFDDAGLAGYTLDGGEPSLVREGNGAGRLVDFCGVQACAPALLDVIEAEPADTFSVMDTYLRQAKRGRRVAAFDGAGGAGGAAHRFLDVGTAERLEQAHAVVAAGDFA